MIKFILTGRDKIQWNDNIYRGPEKIPVRTRQEMLDLKDFLLEQNIPFEIENTLKGTNQKLKTTRVKSGGGSKGSGIGLNLSIK